MSENDLPQFDDPPVVEVAVSLQFSPIQELDAARLGLAWRHYRDHFPRVEMQPSVARLNERRAAGKAVTLSFQLEQGVPNLRFWFLNVDGTRLVQLQNDRISFNWRKAEGAEQYPSYRTVSASFRAQL
jgi:uncharacterized protein (TIGR04255 family)